MNGKEDSKAKIIGTALKEWIEKSPYSKADVARMLGVSPQYINGLCQGKPIGKVMANKIANLFGLSEYYLLTGEGSLLVDEGSAKVQDTDSGELEALRSRIKILEEQVARQRQIIDHYESFVELLTRENRQLEQTIDNPFVSDNTPASAYDPPSKK